MIKTISVGLIGCGKIAEVCHLPAYQVIRKARVVAVADVNVEKTKRVAERFNIKSFYRDPMEIIERKDIDAVDICLPTFLHSKFAMLASEAGKHVFCEKPLAMSVKDADAVISKVNKSGIKLMVGYNQRYEAPFSKVKDLIESRVLGDLISFEVKYAKCEEPERYLPPNWRSDPAKGGGVLRDLACHKIDLMRWFAGEVQEVSAMTAHYLKAKAEDTAEIALRFAGGALGVLSVGLVCVGPSSELDLTKGYGSKGTVWYSSEKQQTLKIYLKGSLLGRTSGFTTLNVSSKKNSYILELETFIDSIIKDKKPPVTAEDAKKVLEIVEAAHESVKSKKAITLKR